MIAVPIEYPTKPRVALSDNFAANVNPLGPPPWLADEASRLVEGLAHYPPLWHHAEERSLATWLGVRPDQVVAANGSSPLIFALIELCVPAARPIAVLEPTFWEYRQAADLAGRDVAVLRREADDLARAWEPGEIASLLERSRPAALFLCNPDNPTGQWIPTADVTLLCEQFPNVLFIVDQTYAPFRRNWLADRIPGGEGPPNAVAVFGLSKLFCLPGLRIGAAVFGNDDMAQRLRNRGGPLRLGSLAADCLPRLLEDADYLTRTVDHVESSHIDLLAALAHRVPWLEPLPTEAPFRLFRIKVGPSAETLADRLLRTDGLRICSGHVYQLPHHVRIRPRFPEENARLARALARHGGAQRTKK